MPEPPDDVLEEAKRLTRQSRAAVDPQEARAYLDRRDDMLAEHGLVARVREEPDGAVLVCYPTEWVDEAGVVRTERITDTDAAIEIRLSGTGPQGDWETADARNRELVESVRNRWGDVHGDNVAAFADFMGNHYARPVDTATAAEIREFLEEYYPRNAWPTPDQAAVIEDSLRHLFELAEEPFPLD